jgi:Protein of unknown function (DUF2852)
MWWYACSAAPWMFFGPAMMMFFILACMAMMFFFMRRHGGFGAVANSGSAMRLGPWRNLASKDTPPSTAFEEYRQETLVRLEREQTEFRSFLEQLRSAKDKAEFDQFMAERQSTAKNPA